MHLLLILNFFFLYNLRYNALGRGETFSDFIACCMKIDFHFYSSVLYKVIS